MAKLNFLILALLLSFNCMSQSKDLPEFNLTDYSFPKAVIVDIETKNKLQLKNDIQNWIDNYYSNSTLLNKSYSEHTFSVTGTSLRLLEIKNLTTELKYDIKISIRDFKYKFEITSIYYKYYTEYRRVSNVNLVKDSIIRNDLLESRSIISSFFNDLNTDLYNSLAHKNEEW